MDDDINVRKLVEFIFIKKLKITSDMTAPDSSFPTSLQVNNFPQKLCYVLLTKQAMACKFWRHVFSNKLDPSVTYEDILNNLMIACLVEHLGEKKVFGSFIAACSIVRHYGKQVFPLHWVNHMVLSCDFIMEFYKEVLKKSFHKCGGFHRFVEYIHHHEYHTWNLDVNDLNFYHELGCLSVETAKKLEKESEKEQIKQRATCFARVNVNGLYERSAILARNICSTTTVKLITSRSGHDSNQDLIQEPNHDPNEESNQKNMPNEKDNPKRTKIKRRKRASKSEPLENALSGNCTLNPDSETTDNPKQRDVAYFENIVQAVRKYNLENAGLTNSDNLKKAEKILSHLKSTIETLLVVLDDYGKE